MTRSSYNSSRTIVNVRSGDKGPILFVWVDGEEVAQYQMDTRSMLCLVEDLVSKCRETV